MYKHLKHRYIYLALIIGRTFLVYKDTSSIHFLKFGGDCFLRMKHFLKYMPSVVIIIHN